MVYMQEDAYIPRRNAYTGGRDGITTGRMISQRDFHNIRGEVFDRKADSAKKAWDSGDLQDPWAETRLRNEANRSKGVVANGGQTGQDYARPEFETDAAMADINEARYGYDGKETDVNEIIDRKVPGLSKYNTGQHMNSMSFGLASGGMGQGSSAGFDDGGGLPQGLREASFSVGNGDRPIISNEAGGRIRQYNDMGDGSFSAGNYLNGAGSAFTQQYRGQSTAGGFAGLPSGQQMQPQAMSPLMQEFPQNQSKPWIRGGGFNDQDIQPSPYQMVNDRKFGKFEGATEDGYGVTSGAPDDDNYQPKETDLPHPDSLDNEPDEWVDDNDPRFDDTSPMPGTKERIEDAISKRADDKLAQNPGDEDALDEEKRTLKALDDYSKRGFLPGYRPEDGTARPSELTAYGQDINGKERTKGIRRRGPMVDAADSVESGAKQIFGRAQDGIKKVFQLSPPELSDDQRFEDVRTHVRSSGKMSREEAQAAGEINSNGDQESVNQFKMRQLLQSIPELQSTALGQGNPRIASVFDDENAGYMRGPNQHHEFGPMEAGQIDAQMTGAKKSPRMDNDKRQVPMRPPTHKEVLAQYLMQALGGGIA